MNAVQKEIMRHCNNYFATLVEHVRTTETGEETITAPFRGNYRTGDVLRIHGAYNGGWGEFGEGEVFEVVTFENGVLTLDHKLHTRAPWLLIVYCEVPREFSTLCEEIAEYVEKTIGREGLASESIDGYSWSAAATGTGWQGAFAERLQPYKQSAPTRLYYARNAQGWPV